LRILTWRERAQENRPVNPSGLSGWSMQVFSHVLSKSDDTKLSTILVNHLPASPAYQP
jgi:hypothetical protein